MWSRVRADPQLPNGMSTSSVQFREGGRVQGIGGHKRFYSRKVAKSQILVKSQLFSKTSRPRPPTASPAMGFFGLRRVDNWIQMRWRGIGRLARAAEPSSLGRPRPRIRIQFKRQKSNQIHF